MSFEPVLPMSGYAGWLFLNRTISAQREQHAGSPERQSDTEYFAAQISKVKTPEDLVGDFRLLKVALGAFGLGNDIQNRAFIRKLLEEGTTSSKALANRLSDKRYLKFSQAFGFGQGVSARTTLTGFADEIVPAYLERQFEISVGAQNEAFRLALDAQRELAAIAGGGLSANGMWYSVMGSPALRNVFETALGLPDTFSSIDLDVQMATFREKSERVLGDGEIAQFTDPLRIEDLVRKFMLRSEIEQMKTGLSPGKIAITLLSGLAKPA